MADAATPSSPTEVEMNTSPYIPADAAPSTAAADEPAANTADSGPREIERPPAAGTGGLEEGLLGDGEMSDTDGLESVIDEPIIADNAFDEESGSPKVPVSKIIPNTPLYKSAFHIFKANVGTGVFLLPTIYNDAGYIAGPIIALLCGAMVIDCTMMLLRCKKKINREEVQTYPQVVAFVFGNVFRIIINVAIVLTQVGFCLLYAQFAAGLLQSIHSYDGAYRIYLIAAFFVVFPLTMMSNNLSLLGITSAIATVCVFFCIFATVGEAGSKLHEGVASVEPVISPLRWVLFVASNMSVLEGIAVVLPVENAAASKERFAPMVKIVLSGVVGMYLIYGMVGYLAYGESLKVSVVNTLELNAFTIIIRVALALNLLMTYPLQFVPAIQIIDQALRIEKHRAGKSSRAIITRVIINLGIIFLAMLIGPETVGLILALIGSLAATILAVILPAMLELMTDYSIQSHERRRGWKYFRNMFVQKPYINWIKLRCFVYMVVGTVTMVVGTITCLFDAASLGHHKNGKSIHHLMNNTATADL